MKILKFIIKSVLWLLAIATAIGYYLAYNASITLFLMFVLMFPAATISGLFYIFGDGGNFPAYIVHYFRNGF